MNKTLAGIGAATLALSFAGCATDVNVNANLNRPNANANVANANVSVTPTPRSALTREEYERDKAKYQKEAKDSGRTVGAGLNDAWLWTKTRFDLAAVDDLRDSTINVDVNNDVVTLTGTVASAEQKAKAEATAKAVEGVKNVKNMLTVAPAGGSTVNQPANNNTGKKH